MTMNVRHALEEDLDALADIWHEAWHYAHAGRVPEELAQDRTRINFRKRLSSFGPSLRTIGSIGNPLGFCVQREAEIYQMFASAEARGTGIASRLLADGEYHLMKQGTKTAFLACVMGNNQAARFYEKHGWMRKGLTNEALEVSTGTFFLECWRYEKELTLSE